jgi:aryl-alcohol dehydrogenase-like predicted oxidoreductase
MEYVELGSTGIEVSRMCLGTAFRSGLDEDTCVAALEEAEALGCNFLDCANVYRDGFSERAVGRFLCGRRDRMILTTKVGAQAGGGPSGGGLVPDAIMRSVEDSLRRLGTDRLDLYLCHFPDPVTPLEETLKAMDQLVAQGKVRFVGCSNFESWRLCEALHMLLDAGLRPLACNEVCYSMLDRRIEHELLPYAKAQKVSITVYAATAIGLLAGRCRYGHPPPEGTSWHRGPYNYRRAMTPHAGNVIDAVIETAGRYGKTPAQVAMAWCLRDDGVTSVITGADTPQRVRENFAAVGWKLADEDLQMLERVSEGHCLQIHKDCPDGYAGN